MGSLDEQILTELKRIAMAQENIAKSLQSISADTSDIGELVEATNKIERTLDDANESGFFSQHLRG